MEDLIREFKKGSEGVVCIYPWNIPQTRDGTQRHVYGLDYNPQSLSGRNIYFSEDLAIVEDTKAQNMQLKNVVTAISRTEHIRDLLKIASYVITEGHYLIDALDPLEYPMIVGDAKSKGIEPWLLPTRIK